MWRICAATAIAWMLTPAAFANGTSGAAVSPIYGVAIPAAYRQWSAVAPSEEGGNLNEIRVIFGNTIAIRALERGTRPLPDGSILVKVAWKRVASARDDAALGSPQAFVPGARSAVADVQLMVKDAKRYVTSGGNDFVFTRYAP